MEEEKYKKVEGGRLNMGQEYLMNIVNDLGPEEFRILSNKLLEKMDFKITSSRMRADDVEIEALREVEGNSEPFVIKVKRGHSDAGPEDIQKMVGRKRGGVDVRAIFISTTKLSKDARKYADLLGVNLADGDKFGLLLKELELDDDLKKQDSKKVLEQDGERFLPSIDELENQMRWGNDFFNSGNFKKAIEYYDNALKMKPNYDLAWIMKGSVLKSMKRMEEAAECFKKALEVNPDSEESWYNLGAIYYELQRYEDEIQCYDQALKINKNFTKAWNNKGATLHEQGKHEEAVLCYDKVLLLEPDNINVLNNKGVALKYLKDYGNALESFDKATAKKDDYKEAWLNKGLLLHDMEQYEHCISCYDKVLGLEKSPEVYYQKGIALMAMEDPRRAIDAFDNSLLLKPYWDLAIEEKKKAEEALKEMDESRLLELEERREREAEEERLRLIEEEEKAKELEEKLLLKEAEEREAREAEESKLAAKKAASKKPAITEESLTNDFADLIGLGSDPNCSACDAPLTDAAAFCAKCGHGVEDAVPLPESELPVGDPPELEQVEEDLALEEEIREYSILFEKSKMLIRMMKYDEALDCLNTTIELEERASSILEKANLLYLMGRFDDAIEYYDKVLKKEPDNISAMMNRATSLIEIGEFEDALRANDVLTELEKEEPALWIERANIHMSLGDTLKAIESFDRAIEIEPGSSEVWNAEGIALLSIGKHDDSILCFDRAIQIDPDFSEAWCNKGNAILASGNPEGSIKYFDRAIDIDQDNDIAWADKAAALYEMDRFKEAISCLDMALNINETPLLLSNKGFVLISDDDLDKAIRILDKAITLDPEHPEAWNNKGIALSRMDEHTFALECFERALGIDPGFRDAIKNRDATVRRLGSQVEPDKAPEPELDRTEIEVAEEIEDDMIAGEQFRCPACDAIGNIDDKFCDKCGTKFTEEEKEEAVIEELEDILDVKHDKKEKPKANTPEEVKKEFVNALVGVPGVGFSKAEAVHDAGFTTFKDLEKASEAELVKVKGISERLAKNIKKVYKQS